MITVEQVERLEHSPEAFMIENSLMIANRDLEDVPFLLNDGQRMLDRKIAERMRQGKPIKFYHPKARRRGVSAYITARFFVKCLTMRNIQAAIVAHKEKDAKKLFAKITYYIKNFRGAKPKLGTDSTIEVTFPETNSSINVLTAGSKETARGPDFNHIHLSEAAFYESPESTVASLVQTIPGRGEIFVESTGNGAGTWYHRRCLYAWQGKSDYGINFIPWHDTEDCYTPIPEGYRSEFMSSIPDPLYEEEELLQNFPNIAPERLLWRRNKIEEFDFDIWLFKQEYPMTFEECFIPTARSYFHKLSTRLGDPRWKRINKDLWLLEGHPQKRLHYAMGADVSAGVENDASVAEIICLETNEQVGEFWSNRIAPNDFAIALEELGRKFRFPMLLVEANNHGHVTLDNLVKNGVYPKEQIFWDEAYSTNIIQAGHTTNRRTKPLMMGSLRTDMAHGLVIYSEGLSGECATFEDTLEAATGCHDDRVIAMGLANKGIYELKRYNEDYEEPESIPSQHEFDAIFCSRDPGITGQRQPIANQLAQSHDIDITSNRWRSSPEFIH